MRAIPECLRGVITTTRYTNPRLPLPLPLLSATHIRGPIFEKSYEELMKSYEKVWLTKNVG